MSGHNILLLSAGRRVELTMAFQESLRRHFPDASVFATDLEPELSAACQTADASFRAPHVRTPGYIDFILDLCRVHHIGLVVPTLDTGLLDFARARPRFLEQGVQAVSCDTALVESCRDKRLTAEVFDRLGLDRPAIYPREHLTFPCFCKPYDGSSSIGAQALLTPQEATNELLSNPRNMFMELVGKEFVEYTVDVYFTSSGELRCLVPRERIAVRTGEISKGATRRNFVYRALLQKLGRVDGARGCVTLQVFANPETEAVRGLEINPRFGGGYPLSHAAGAEYTDWLIREYLLGESIPFYDDWEDELLMLRYDAKVLVHAADRR